MNLSWFISSLLLLLLTISSESRCSKSWNTANQTQLSTCRLQRSQFSQLLRLQPSILLLRFGSIWIIHSCKSLFWIQNSVILSPIALKRRKRCLPAMGMCTLSSVAAFQAYIINRLLRTQSSNLLFLMRTLLSFLGPAGLAYYATVRYHNRNHLTKVVLSPDLMQNNQPEPSMHSTWRSRQSKTFWYKVGLAVHENWPTLLMLYVVISAVVACFVYVVHYRRVEFQDKRSRRRRRRYLRIF